MEDSTKVKHNDYILKEMVRGEQGWKLYLFKCSFIAVTFGIM